MYSSFRAIRYVIRSVDVAGQTDQDMWKSAVLLRKGWFECAARGANTIVQLRPLFGDMATQIFSAQYTATLERESVD
jgi:hypothetical protein